jgi:hypothetical protein
VTGRLDLARWRAAWWTWRALRAVRGALPSAPVTTLPVRPAPRLPARAVTGVEAVLRRQQHTCLMRAVVLQAWYAGQGEQRAVVIGVTPPSRGFTAHAWIDGEPPCHDAGFTELTRWPAGGS